MVDPDADRGLLGLCRHERLEDVTALDKKKKHTIEIVIDRVSIDAGDRARLTDSVETAVKAGGGSFHHGLTWHGSAPNVSGTVARMALVSHFLPMEARFHETNVDVTYSRYRRRGDLSLDESFFPVVWDGSGYRTPWLAELPALD